MSKNAPPEDEADPLDQPSTGGPDPDPDPDPDQTRKGQGRNRLEKIIGFLWLAIVPISLFLGIYWTVRWITPTKVSGSAIIPIIALTVVVINNYITHFVNYDLKNIRLSRRLKIVNVIAITALVGLCSFGGYEFFREVNKPPREQQVLGYKLFNERSFRNLPVTEWRNDGPGAQLVQFLDFWGEIVNDTDSTIDVEKFRLEVGRDDWPVVYMWKESCNSGPISLKPGQNIAAYFRVYMLKATMDSYGLLQYQPKLKLDDDRDNTWNVRNIVVNDPAENTRITERVREDLVTCRDELHFN